MSKSSSPMIATEATLVSLPEFKLDDPQSIIDFRGQVTLQTQGGPAIFEESAPLSALALGLATVYEVATELSLRLVDGRLALIFSHETRETTRLEETDETIWLEINKLRKKMPKIFDVLLPISEKVIDLSNLWEQTTGDDVVVRTKIFLKNLVPVLTPATTIRLQGKIPALPLLAAAYLSRPIGYRVEYQENNGVNLVLFF